MMGRDHMVSYSELLNRLCDTRQASVELLALLKDTEQRIQPGFIRIEQMIPGPDRIDATSERMKEAANLLYLLYTFRQYLTDMKREIERINAALQHSMETVHAAVLVEDLDTLVYLNKTMVFEKITELSQMAEEVIGSLVEHPSFTIAVADYETLLETAERLIHEEVMQGQMRLGKCRIIASDTELEACVRSGSALSVWKDGDLIYECGTPASFSRETVSIDDIHFSRSNLTFAMLLSDTFQ
jgi:hypothetical protein